MTATPPATLTAATAAAALMATPPAKSPPPVADAAPAPVPTPAATVLAPTTVPAPATTGTVAALAVPAPSRPLKMDSESGIGMSMQPAQRSAMALLEARELRAVGALGEVVAEPAALLAAKAPVDGLRDGELGLGARELLLELLGERAARAEEQGLERACRDAEDLRDLGVRTALELAQDDRLALLGRDLRERGEELADARAVLVRLAAGDPVVELDRSRPRLLLPEALLDRVARDREQPVRRLSRANALARASGTR